MPDRSVKVRNRHGFVRRVRRVHRPRAEEQRLAPLGRERECPSCTETPPSRNPAPSSGARAARRGRARSRPSVRAAAIARRTSSRVAHRAEHHFGFGRRRDDVRRDAAGDESDRVMRPAEHRVRRQRHLAQRDERIEQLVDRRVAQLGKRRMRGAAGRAQLDAQDPARRGAEAIVGRLAVDQKPAQAAGVRAVGDLRAVAAALFADDKQQADARLTLPRGARPPPRPAPRECLSRRTIPGRRADRPRRGSERTAARNRSASRGPPTAGRGWRAR